MSIFLIKSILIRQTRLFILDFFFIVVSSFGDSFLPFFFEDFGLPCLLLDPSTIGSFDLYFKYSYKNLLAFTTFVLLKKNYINTLSKLDKYSTSFVDGFLEPVTQTTLKRLRRFEGDEARILSGLKGFKNFVQWYSFPSTFECLKELDNIWMPERARVWRKYETTEKLGLKCIKCGASMVMNFGFWGGFW